MFRSELAGSPLQLFLLFNGVFQFRPFQKAAFEQFDIAISKPRQFSSHVTRILFMGAGAIKNERFIARKRDGKWIACVSNETGKNEVYVRTFPPGN